MPPPCPFWGNGTERVGVLITLIGRLAWPRSPPCPIGFFWPMRASSWNQISLALPVGMSSGVGLKRIGEVFLKAAITASSCPGCCGRALMWEKPRDASSFEMVRSQRPP